MSSLWFEHSSGHIREKILPFWDIKKPNVLSMACGVEPSDFMPFLFVMWHTFSTRYFQEPNLREETKSCSSLVGYSWGSFHLFLPRFLDYLQTKDPKANILSLFMLCKFEACGLGGARNGLALCIFHQSPRDHIMVLSLFFLQQWQRGKWPILPAWATWLARVLS